MENNNLNKRLNSIRKVKEQEYGSFNDNMKDISIIWSALLSELLKKKLSPHHVCLMYTAAKLIRAAHNFKEDSYIDAQNYLEQARLMHEQHDLQEFTERF
jgi:hypothetical protein